MKDKIIELVKYGIYGGFTTAINLFLFFVFNEAGMYYLLANATSYAIAVCVNYFLNKKFVFKTNDNSNKQNIEEFLKFVVVRVASLVLDSVLFYIVVDVLKMNVYIGRILLSMAIIFVTFFINKLFVFKKK